MADPSSTQRREQKRRAAARRSTRWGRRRFLRARFGLPLALAIGSGLSAPAFAQNLPQGGNVTGGSGTIQQINPNLLTIQQNSQNLSIDWQSFSVGSGSIVRFLQPSSSAIALNRVIGNDPSMIFGQIQANGQVILLNPRGIYFGPNSSVDVNALVATTANIRNDDFMAGRLRFDEGSGDPNARIVNEGLISVAQGGFAVLAAAGVQNTGRIVANGGSVVLAGTKTFTIDFHGDGLLSFAATGLVEQAPSGASALVENSGIIEANGGRVLMTARAARNVLDNVINTTGIVVAQTAQMVNGEIIIDGGDNGIVNVNGLVDASGKGAGETGGTVKVLGEKVGLFQNARLDVSGDAGGGTVLVGGNYQGKGPEANAKMVYMDAAAVIDAGAINSGDGGRVILWSDDATRNYGHINVAGPRDGGFIEVSSKGYLDFAGTVDLSGLSRNAGTLLLDPADITIQTGVDSNLTGSSPFQSTGAASSNLTPTTLLAALLSGNVTVTTSAGSGGTGNITINSAVAYVSAVTRTLTLQADNDITISGSGSISSTLNPLTLNLWAANNIAINGTVDTNNGDIVTQGQAGTGSAVNFSNTGTINVGTGNLVLNQSGTISFDATVTSTGTISLGNGGAVTQTAALDGVGTLALGAGSTGSVTLNHASNAFNTITLSRTGTTSNVSLVTSVSPNVQASTLGTGTFSLTGVGFTQSGSITQDIGGGAVTIDGGTGSTTLSSVNTIRGAFTVNSNSISATAAQNLSSSLTLAPGSPGTNIVFNGGGGGLQLSNATLTIFSGYTSMTVGSLASGTLSVANAFTAPTNTDLTLLSGGAMTAAYALATSGTGSIALSSGTSVSASANITTAGGDIYITGNVASWAPAYDVNTPVFNSTSGSFAGVSLAGGITLDAGGGDISIAGKGGDSGASQYGVQLAASSFIQTSGAGKITITGTGGAPAGGNSHTGFEIAGSVLTTGTGTIKLTGVGGAATGASNQSYGVNILATGSVDGGAADVTLTGTGGSMSGSGNTNYGIQVLGQIQTTSGDITITGTGSDSSGGANFGVSISGGADVQTTGAGSVTIAGYGGNAAGGLGHGVAISGNGTNVGKTGTGAGTVSITGVGGLAGGNNAGIYLDNNVAIASFDGGLTLDGTGGGDGTTASNYGTMIDTGTTLASTSGAITIAGIGGGSSGNGNHGINMSASADITSASGNISLAANASGTGNNDAISIDNSSIRSTGAANITLRAASYGTAGTGIRFLGALAKVGETTMTGNTVLRADAMTTSATSLVLTHAAASGTITFRTENDAATIGINGGTGTLQVDSGLLGGIANFATTRIGFTTQSGTISANAWTPGRAAYIETAGAVSTDTLTMAGNALTIDAGGAYTQTNGISGSGLVTLAGTGAVTANDPSNTFTSVAFNKTGAAGVAVTTTGALDFAASTLGSGAFNVTAAGLTQSGAVATSGAILFNAGANAITLANTSNAFSGTVRFFNTGVNNVTFYNNTATNFGGGSTSTGNDLTVTSTGAMTQASALTVGGAASFVAGANAITLNNAANAVTGSVTLSNSGANAVSWREAAAVTLAASSAGSSLTVQAGGNITQIGALNVGTTSSFNAGANIITLTNAGNSFAGAVTLINTGANAVQLTNAGAIDLNGSSVGGNLTLVKTGAGDITQSTPLNVGGNLSVDAGSGLITLNQGANSITGTVALSSTNAGTSAFQNGGPLALGVINVTGNLDITANSGSLTQVAAATIGGNASFTTGSYAITLTNASNSIGGTVALTNTGANNVALTSNGPTTLAATSVGGNLTVTSNGFLTQSAAMTVGGNLSLDAGSSNLTMAQAANSVTGSVALTTTGSGDATWVETGATAFAATGVGGNLNVTSTGAITQSGPLSIGGTSSFAAGTNAITLSSLANSFTGAVSASNSGVATTTDVWAGSNLTLGTINVGGGALTLKTSGANILQTGSITQAAGGGAVLINAIGGNAALSQINSFSGDVTVAGDTASITAAQNVTGAGKYFILGPTTSAALSANITTNNGQIGVQPDVTLTGTVSLNAGTADIYFSNAVNGAAVLTATTTGEIDFFGIVGGTTPLTSLTASAGTVIGIHDDITTTGSQSYTGAGNVTFSGGAPVITGSGITFANAISDAAATANIDAGAGTLVFGGSVNLAGLTANGSSIQLGGDVTTVVGGLTFDAPVSFTGNRTLTAASTLTMAGASWTSGSLTLNGIWVDLNAGTYASTGGGLSATGDVAVALTGATITTVGGNISLTGNLSATGGGDFSGVSILASSNVSAGGGNVTIYGQGGDDVGGAQHGILVNASQVQTSGAGAISMTGIGGTSTGIGNSGVSIDAAGSISAGTGGLTVTGTGGSGTANFNNGIELLNGGAASSLGGSVLLTGIAGSSTTNGSGVVLQSGASVSTTGGGGITLDGSATTNMGLVGNSSNTITSSGALTLTSNNGVAFDTVDLIAPGAFTVNSTFANVALGGTGNTLGGTATLTASGGGDLNLANLSATQLGATNISGALSIISGSAIIQSAAMTVGGNADFTATTGNIVLTNSNNVTGSVALTTISGDASFVSSGAQMIGAGSVTGNLSVTASGDITQVGAIYVGGTSSFTAGAHQILINNAGNDLVGAVSLSNSGNNDVSVVTTQGLVIATSFIGSGALTLQSGTALPGTITQTGAITQAAGAGAVSLQSDGDITLANASNHFTGDITVVGTNGGNVSLANNTNTLIGGAQTSGGTFTLVSGGAITQTGSVNTGDLNLTAAGNIVMTDLSNMAGDVSLTTTAGGNASYYELGTTVLKNVNVAGNLMVDTTGDLNQAVAGSMVVGGTSSLISSGGIVNLSLANSFGNTVTVDSFLATNITALQTVATGGFSLNAGDTITVNGGGGVATSGGAIALTTTSNIAFSTGSLASNGGTIDLIDGPSNFIGVELLFSNINSGTGNINIQGTGGTTSNTQAGIWVGSGSTVTASGAGTITLTGTGGATTGSGNVGVFVYGGTVQTTGSGLLTVNGTGGGTAASTGSNYGVSVQAGGQISATGTGDIMVIGTGATAGGSGSSNHGIAVSGSGSKIESASGTITALGTGGTSTGGNSSGVKIDTDGKIATTSGDITVSATGGGGTSYGIEFANGGGTGGIVSGGAGLLNLSGIGNSAAGVRSSGTTSNIGGVSATGNILIGSNGLDLDTGVAIQTAAVVTFMGTTPTATLGLNDAASDVNVSNALLSNITAGALELGSAGQEGLITVGTDGAVSATMDIGLFNTGAGSNGVVIAGPLTTTGNLNIHTADSISQTSAITVGGYTMLNADGDITMGDPGNVMTGGISFASTAGNVVLASTGSTAFGASSASGSLDVYVTGGGTVSQLGAITAGGTLTLNSDAAVTWMNAGNVFGGPLNLLATAGAGIAINNSLATTLDNANVSGGLTVASGGTLTQGGSAYSVGGSSTFSSVGAMTLGNAGNSFAGPVLLTTTAGGNSTIAGTGQLILGSSSIAGNFLASVGSPMTQTGALAVAGTAGFTATGGPLTLTNSSNTFGGAVSLTNTGNFSVGIAASGALTLGNVSMGGGSTGGFSATATNGISQAGGTTIQAGSGATVLAGGGGQVNLGDAGNAFGNTVSLSGTGGTLGGSVNGLTGAAAAPFVTATGGIFSVNGVSAGSVPVVPPTTQTTAQTLTEIASVAPIDSVLRVETPTVTAGFSAPSIDATLSSSTGDLSGGGGTGTSGSTTTASGGTTEESTGGTTTVSGGPAPTTQSSGGAPAPTGTPSPTGNAAPPTIVLSDNGGTTSTTDVRSGPAPQPGPVTLVPGLLVSNPPAIPSGTAPGGTAGITDSFPIQGNSAGWQ